MKSSWHYHIVSNYLRISRAFFAVIILFLGTEAAADTIGPPVVFRTCLPKKVLGADKPLIPLPDPQPFQIGCLIPGCDLAGTGPLELIVELSGDLIPSAQLKIDGLSRDQIPMLQHSGGIQPVRDQQTTFELEPGRSRVSGLRVDLGTRMRTEDLVTMLLERTATPIIPTVQLHLSVDAEEAEKWTTKKGKEKAQKAGPKIVIDLKVTHGETTINESITEYALILCPEIPTDLFDHDPPLVLDGNPTPPVDWIHVTEQVGGVETNFGDDSLALINGRIENGSTTPPLTEWVEPRVYNGKAIFPMPQNIWSYDPAWPVTDESGCKQQDIYTGIDEPCWPEVSVFARDRKMTLKRVAEWTDGLGDLVPVSVKVPPEVVKVPVYFYILWEHHTAGAGDVTNPGGDPCTPADSTYCLAQTRLTDARTFFSNIKSGIDFEIIEVRTNTTVSELFDSGCDNRNMIHSLLNLESTATNPPTGLWVYFVRKVVEDTFGGRLIHNGQTCLQPVFNTNPNSPTDVHPAQLNEIFISTGVDYNSTTLAHEFGHALSLDDVNEDSTKPKVHAPNLSADNLMWSGSSSRDTATIAQMFRVNINKLSAVYRLNVPANVSELPRWCHDFLINKNCPALDPTP